jgi:hypothetical protein
MQELSRVYVNKSYGENEVRHLRKFADCSVSGQYEIHNFKELLNQLNVKEKIYFVDTRQDTHFVLNGRACVIKTDDNSQKSSEDIEKRESDLVKTLLNTTVVFEGLHTLPTKEQVVSSSTIRQFVENPLYNNSYVRFALDEHGPLTDAEVDYFQDFLSKIKSENAWMHTNSIVGGAAAILLAVMKRIRESAESKTLDEILAEDPKFGDMKKEPKVDDVNAGKKRERLAFLQLYHAYAQSHQGLSFSAWKKTS